MALTAEQFQGSTGTGDWRVLGGGAYAWFATSSHAAGAALAARIGGPVDIDVRSRGVRMRIRQPDAGLARAISAAAHDLGLPADPSQLHTMQLAFDVVDRAAVLPFWRTALAYEPVGDDVLVDPQRRDPPIWFQQADRLRPLRNRLHLDVSPPYSRTPANDRFIGGAFGVAHADAEGNEVDIIPMEPIDGLADWAGPFVGTTFYPDAPASFVSSAADIADAAGLPLLIDIRPDGVTVDTGKDQQEDERFADLARRIQHAARDNGLTADLTRIRFVQIGIDAVDVATVRNFWRIILGYEYDPRPQITDIYDPRRLNVPFFFQEMTESEVDRRRQRNRIHVDVFVPDDQAQVRIERALAAGGRIVYDAEAPDWWTIADPEGNEVDIAVAVGREERRQARSHA